MSKITKYKIAIFLFMVICVTIIGETLGPVVYAITGLIVAMVFWFDIAGFSDD